jgi:hypothetical protein
MCAVGGVAPNIRVANELQFLKALPDDMLSTTGAVTEVRLLQPSNILSPISFTFGSVAELNAVQLLNTVELPITTEGSSICVSEVQLLNAPEPTSTTLGRFTVSKPLQEEKL